MTMKGEHNTNERATWWDESPSPATTHSQPPAHPQQQQYAPHSHHQAEQQPHPQHYVEQPHPHYVAQPVETGDPDPGRRHGFDWDKIAFIVLAVLLPPLGVFFETGCNKDFAINVLLTLLGCDGDRGACVAVCVSTGKRLTVGDCLQVPPWDYSRCLRDPERLADGLDSQDEELQVESSRYHFTCCITCMGFLMPINCISSNHQSPHSGQT